MSVTTLVWVSGTMIVCVPEVMVEDITVIILVWIFRFTNLILYLPGHVVLKMVVVLVIRMDIGGTGFP